MRTSRNGQWIIDDPRFKYIISDKTMGFLKIVRYQYGFNSLSFIYEDEDMKEIETTIPRNLFKRIAYPNFVEAMIAAIQKHKSSEAFFSQNDRQRMFEYTTFLAKYYPEKLI